jgi:hypothetical protein
MKRFLFLVSLALLTSGCVHRWVGRPVAQLEKEYGSPRNIRSQGENRIYYYPDTLAGRGEMTFTVDRKGIIREWCATANVPGPFQDEVLLDDFGNVGFGGNSGTVAVLNPGGANGGVGSRVRNLPQSLPAGTCQ